MIELAEGDPARIPFEEASKGWVITQSPEGFVMSSTTNHRISRDFLKEVAPEILSMKLKPDGVTCGILHFINPKMNLAISLCGGWITPDADDPERLEGGWFVSHAAAPIEHAANLQSWFVGIIKQTMKLCENDHYVPCA